jgi:uncharacterized membrane protein
MRPGLKKTRLKSYFSARITGAVFSDRRKPAVYLTLRRQKTKLIYSIRAYFFIRPFYPMTFQHKLVLIYTSTLMGIVLWIILIVLAPYLKSQSSFLAKFIYAVFAPTCHQIPSRCFHIFGHPMAVCSRCMGIYAGFFLGTVVFPFIRGFSAPSFPRARAIILFSVPMAIDVAGHLSGMWSSSNATRFLTGVLWGIILPFYFIAGISDYFLRRNQRSESSNIS